MGFAPRESRMWAHIWMALYRPDVQWGVRQRVPYWIAARCPL